MADKVKVMQIDTQPAVTSVKELRQQLKSLKDTMLSCEQGTEEYNAALQQAAEIQHELKEQMELVNANAMDFGQITQNATRAVGGMVSGFQAATAVMNLFGSENEDVMKALQKMQSLMALTQSFSGLDNGIKAFKNLGMAVEGGSKSLGGFKKALIGTGLGAIVVVLGSIIANWDEFTKAIGLSENAMNKLKDVVNGVMGVLKSSLKGLTEAIMRIVTGDFKGAWEAVKNGFDVVSNYNAAVAEGIAEREAEAAKKSAEAWGKYVEKRKQQLQDEKELEEAKQEDGWKYTEAGKKYYENYFNELFKLYSKDSREYNQVLIQKLNYEKAYNKENQKETEKASEEKKRTWKDDLKELEINNKLHLAELKKNLDDGLMLEEEYNKKKKELYEEDTQNYINYLNALLENEELNAEDRLAIIEKINKARQELQNGDENGETDKTLEGMMAAFEGAAETLQALSDNPAWANIADNITQIAAIFDDLNKNHIEKGSKEAMAAYAQVAAVAFSAIGNMMDGLAKEQDASTKEGFEQQKKFQIAAATMNMLGGIISAWVSAMNPANAWMTIWGQLAMGAAMTAMIAASGAIQIGKIKKQKFGGSDTGGGSSATPSASAVSAINAPVQYTQDVQGASIEESLQSQRVYVVESDITNTQNRVEVTENEARF